MRFFVEDFFWERVGFSSWSLAFRTILMCATVSAQDVWKYCGRWSSIVGNPFVHKNSICAHHAEHADRLLVSREFKSVYFQTQAHSASCQTRSLETRLWVSARFRIIIWIGWYILTVEECDSAIAGTQSGGNFSEDRKSVLKRLRLNRQVTGSVISF